jgi:5-methylcytosine-specific restriction protein A
MSLEEIRPKARQRVYDLVREAGLDVSDWANYAGGKRKAAANPKYCYEWAFDQTGAPVILNIWYANVETRGRQLVLRGNMRPTPERRAARPGARGAVWERRADAFDKAVNAAASAGRPVRAIVCDGVMRRVTEGKPSQVRARFLDPLPWAVTTYDHHTGDFTLTRGALPKLLVDQFTPGFDGESPAEKRSVKATAFARSVKVRRAVLRRANGRCEYCGVAGFTTVSGAIFLEIHHVVPLGEGGHDSVRNTVAVCPNHHREAHFGASSAVMRDALLDVAAGKRNRGGLTRS